MVSHTQALELLYISFPSSIYGVYLFAHSTRVMWWLRPMWTGGEPISPAPSSTSSHPSLLFPPSLTSDCCPHRLNHLVYLLITALLANRLSDDVSKMDRSLDEIIAERPVRTYCLDLQWIASWQNTLAAEAKPEPWSRSSRSGSSPWWREKGIYLSISSLDLLAAFVCPPNCLRWLVFFFPIQLGPPFCSPFESSSSSSYFSCSCTVIQFYQQPHSLVSLSGPLSFSTLEADKDARPRRSRWMMELVPQYPSLTFELTFVFLSSLLRWH